MRKTLTLILVLCALPLAAQPLRLPRPSPNATLTQTVGVTDIVIKYSRPGVKGRQIWGGLVPYDAIWRTGANEATTINFSDDVLINGQKLPKGTYAFFTIPGKDSWSLVFNSQAEQWGAFTLGVSDATPIEMANVFATLAAEGNYCEPLPVRAILNPDGSKTKYRGKLVAGPRCHRVVSQDVARAATDAARCVTGYGSAKGSCDGWSTSPMVYATLHRPVAGKSGTTDNNRTAWFCGFTPQLAGAAFVADPDDPNDYVGSGRSTISKYTFAETLRDALKGQPKLKFTPPSKQIAWHGDRDGTDDADTGN